MKIATSADSSETIFEYLVTRSRQNLSPVDEVYLTLDDIAAGTGKSKRSVSYALDRLTRQGKVLDRKPRKIRIKVPNGTVEPRDFHGADLSGQNLRGRNFRGMDLSRAKLDGANLAGANLRDTSLSQTSFKGANLEGANLRGAHAAWADFGESNLVDVDAIGTAVTRSNLIGAHVDGLKIGTPLAQFSLWDNVSVEPEQMYGMVGISYTHFIMATMFDQVLKGKPATPFISGMIESERYGCWKAYLTRMALYYPEYFLEWVRGWRDPKHDKIARVWMEFEIMRIWQAMHGVPEPEIYERLIDPTLPRIWLVYIRLLKNVQGGLGERLDAIISVEEVDQLGGCMDSFWTSSDTETPPAGALMPSCVGQSDDPKEAHRRLVNTFSLIEPLSTGGLLDLIKAEFGKGKTQKENGRANGKHVGTGADHSMADAAG